MAGVDEPLQPVGAAVRLVRREPADAVVAPVVLAVERVDRQQLDQVDAQVDEVVEPLDGGVEGALRGERADVQLVEDAAGQLPAGPGAGRSRRTPSWSYTRLGPCTPSGCHGERGSGSGWSPSSSRKA